jgi:hypothetical protein
VINGIKKDLDMRCNVGMTKSLLLMMELGIPWLNTRLVHVLPSHPSLLGVTHAASEFVQDLLNPLWFNHIQGE